MPEERSKRNLYLLLKQDYHNNSKKSFIILLFYRLMHAAHGKKWGGCLAVLSLLRGIVYFLLRIDAQISHEAEIGEDIRLPHSATGVVVSSFAEIENHITIYHQVTIGINENLPVDKRKVIIRNGSYLSVGCKIINAEVGERSKVGPNAVVYKDLPADSLYVATGTNLHYPSEHE